MLIKGVAGSENAICVYITIMGSTSNSNIVYLLHIDTI